MFGWRKARSEIRQAHTLLEQGKAAEALPLCQEAVRQAPGSYEAWMNLNRAYLDLKRYADSLDACEQALRIQPEGSWAWKNKGLALIQIKRYDEALEAATHVPFVPQYIQGIMWIRGSAYRALRRHKELLDATNYWIEHSPQEPLSWHWLGLALYSLKRYEEALDAFRRAIELMPTDANYYNYGNVLFRADHYADATLALTHCLAIKPDHAGALNTLGCVYLHLQYYERALSIFERVIALDAHLASVWSNIAEGLICLGRYDEAKERLEKAREVEMAHPSSERCVCTAVWLGILHTRQGQFDEALAAFKEAFTIDSDNDEAWMGFTELLIALGETEKAAQTIKKAIALSAFDARAWSLKGRILRAAGDEGGAAEAERHGAELLAQQRAELAEFEREHPEWANLGKED
jgi:tetratricopeptide (TPR) repeat protein